MTTEISDAAHKLIDREAYFLHHSLFEGAGVCPRMICINQALLKIYNAARNSGLEDAANVAATMAERPFDSEPEFSACLAVERAIRAMKVTP